MKILDKIRILQGERNWTDYKLAQEADIPYGTLAAMFQRGTPPKVDTLQSICNAFGITLSQFFLENEESEILNENEKEMLKVFRRLSPKQQKALIDVFEEE